jgi:Spy/CpxP family protein refolding chaperone
MLPEPGFRSSRETILLKIKARVMKKLSIVLVCALAVMPAVRLFAQSNVDEELQLVRDQWGVDKKQLIMQYMKFTDAESKKFWPVYDAFMKENRPLMDTRIGLIKDYAKNYGKFTDLKATEITNKLLDNDMGISRLQKTYYAKFSAAITPKRASQYLQVEYYLLTNLKTMIQDEIPFIGELEKTKKETSDKKG